MTVEAKKRSVTLVIISIILLARLSQIPATIIRAISTGKVKAETAISEVKKTANKTSIAKINPSKALFVGCNGFF